MDEAERSEGEEIGEGDSDDDKKTVNNDKMMTTTMTRR